MLFISTTAAARIERAEAETARAFGELSRDQGADVLIAPIGGTFAVFGGPGQPFNKLAGLGFAPLDEDELVRLEAEYDARGAEIRVEQATLADPSVASLLTRRGYELVGYENVLGLELNAAVGDDLARLRNDDVARGIQVSACAVKDLPLWVQTVTDGFMQPDSFDGPPPTESFSRETIERLFANFGGVSNCRFYLARRDEEIAGGGSLRISGALAQLSGASTLVAHRRRGVQSALLRGRLLDAAERGCDLAVVTTEPASKSQQNVQRAGFALLYSRAVLIRHPRR